jgi:5-methylcytosine-specific restriction endonuclease McrA
MCSKPIELIGAHIDRIKPIATHPHLALETYNLQIACLTCNASKGDKDKKEAWHKDFIVAIALAKPEVDLANLKFKEL